MGDIDVVDDDVLQGGVHQGSLEPDFAAVIPGFAHDEDDSAVAPGAVPEHVDTAVDGVDHAAAGTAGLDAIDGEFDLVGVVGEVLRDHDAAIEFENCSLALDTDDALN